MPAPSEPLRVSFTELSEYDACPLRFRYLYRDRLPEPEVPPDWGRAPTARRLTVPSSVDLVLGRAVHAALREWQEAIDRGGPRSTADLLATVDRHAAAAGLRPSAMPRVRAELARGLTIYAEGPWPARRTLALEHSAHHVLRGVDGFQLELALRVDRVTSYRSGFAILDFKTVPPHPRQLRADEWQLRTYALAAAEVLDVAPGPIYLFLVDLRRGRQLEVDAGPPALRRAADELLARGRGIAAGDFEIGEEHLDRPCWSCGFRLTCPASLAPEPPPSHSDAAPPVD